MSDETKKTMLRGLSVETHRRIKERARVNRRSMNSEILLLIEAGLRQAESQTPKS